MGHMVNGEKTYHLLQQRLDHNLTGAPYSKAFIEILRLLFTPEEAELARQIPMRPSKLADLAHKLNMPQARLHEQINTMAERGLVFDIEHNGECYIVLAPVVIGFFEFVFMRTRGDLPMAELAHLFETYMFENDRFGRSVFSGHTQLGRALVREESLPQSDYSEVLDWEKASAIINSASFIGVSLCACRHKASHLGKSCGAPERTCLTFNASGEMLTKRKMAEEISREEARQIVKDCKTEGLVQIADNVKQQVGFLCNCCGCCCGMLQAIRTLDIRHAVVTSNWLACVDGNSCIGCGRCLCACPVGAIRFINNEQGAHAIVEEEVCLGCGVCQTACKLGAIALRPRAQRVVVPETTFDRLAAMAIERGKLANVLFDDPSRLSHRALGRLASIIENSPPVKAALAIKPLRSAFLSALVKGVEKYNR